MKEIWKDIPQYEGYYQASNLGLVRSIERIVFGKSGSRVLIQGKVLVGCINKYGYRAVLLCKDGGRVNKLVHRLILQTFKPEGEKEQVNHINGVKTDNRLSNLEWNTHLENMQHSVKAGLRDYKGEKHYNSKLTKADVLEIRVLLKNGDLQKHIAKRFKVSKWTISNIKNGRSWSHV